LTEHFYLEILPMKNSLIKHKGNMIAVLIIAAALGAAIFLSNYRPATTTPVGTVTQEQTSGKPSAGNVPSETAKTAESVQPQTAKQTAQDLAAKKRPSKAEAGPLKSAKSKSSRPAKQEATNKGVKAQKPSLINEGRIAGAHLAEEVYDLTYEFTRAFDEGNLNDFLSLFSKSATGNDILTYRGIGEAYGDLFDKRLYRFKYSMGNTVIREKEKVVVVSGSFVMQGTADDGTGVTRKGTFKMTLARENGQLKITHLIRNFI
jgi:hypothetical protein